MENTKKNRNLVLKIVTISCLAAAGFGLNGCNTIEGVGEDVEAAGDAISDTARDAKD
jgi:predicted small secreted protein